MECPQCLKRSELNFTCKNCTLLFCSTNCKINHFFDEHKSVTSTKSIPLNTNGIINKPYVSPFIVEGKLIKTVLYDSLYSLDNLDQVFFKNKPVIVGSGTFSKVYLYKNKIDSRFYAVKHMNKKKINEICGNLDIIYKEIELQSKLVHKNIIRLYNVQETPTTFDLVMEYAKGGTLFSLTKKTEGMDEDTAFKYFIQACAAIHFLHINNLLHRDIKPENLLIDENDQVKLCDFGWCKEIEIGSRSTFCGTIEYMAPEIIKEEPYDKSIDVWALGVLLYEIMHGYSPFRATEMNNNDVNMEVFKNILSNNLHFDKKLSQECKDTIMRMIEPDNSKRITIEEVFQMPFVRRYDSKERELINKQNNDSHRSNNKDNTKPQIKEPEEPKSLTPRMQSKKLASNQHFPKPSNPNQEYQMTFNQEDKSCEKNKANLITNSTNNSSYNDNHNSSIYSHEKSYSNNNVKHHTTNITAEKLGGQDNELYFNVLDQVSKKNKTKKKSDKVKKDKGHNGSQDCIREERKHKGKEVSKFNSTTVLQDVNANNDIYLNKVTRESVKNTKSPYISNSNSNSNTNTPDLSEGIRNTYDVSKKCLIDVANLVDMTSGHMNSNNMYRPKKPTTSFWDNFFKPFKCE